NYKLGSQNPQDNATWGLGRVLLPSGTSVAPGATYTFSFNVTAPTTPANYTMQWQMLQEGVAWFGAKSSATVGVGNPPTVTVTQTPSPLVAGQAYTTTWSTTNATSIGYTCIANGTGFAGSASNLAASGSSSSTAQSAW